VRIVVFIEYLERGLETKLTSLSNYANSPKQMLDENIKS